MAGGGEGVDLFLTDEQQDLMTTGFEDLGNGDAWVKVTAGAAAGDEDGRGFAPSGFGRGGLG
jgi:hypothetical protein